MGRPPKPPEEKLVQGSIRLPQELWNKVRRNGPEWLRSAIKRAKDKKE